MRFLMHSFIPCPRLTPDMANSIEHLLRLMYTNDNQRRARPLSDLEAVVAEANRYTSRFYTIWMRCLIETPENTDLSEQQRTDAQFMTVYLIDASLLPQTERMPVMRIEFINPTN